MKERIDTCGSELLKTDLFSRCGHVDGDLPDVKTWKGACSKSISARWENLKFDAQNDLSSQAFGADSDRFQRWNDHISYIEGEWIPPLLQHVEAKLAQHGLEQQQRKGDVSVVISDDLVQVLIYAVYSDLVEVPLFQKMQQSYLAGRYPCGWEGKYPEGRLLVF